MADRDDVTKRLIELLTRLVAGIRMGEISSILTGIRNDSATNLARAFNCGDRSVWAKDNRKIRKWERTKSFISDISLSTSSMNSMIKSTNLCFNMSSVWKFVIRNEIS
jgi:hypothetical protein